MLEFYRFSPFAIAMVVIISTLCVIVQVIAILASFNRYIKIAAHRTENLLEIFLLIQNLILSLLISRIATDAAKSIVVQSGYVALRYGVFAALVLLAVVVSILRRRPFSLVVIPAVFMTLPFVESLSGRLFPWVYMSILLFWIGRAVYVCIQRRHEMQREVSALSVKGAMDALHSGLLYYRPSSGRVYLSNRRMENLMISLMGSIQRNGRTFWQALQSGGARIKPESLLLDGQVVFRTENDTVWLFAEHEMTVVGDKYMQISAIDVSEQWKLTNELWEREEILRQHGEKLAAALDNLDIIHHEEEMLRLKSKVHDMMAQRLAVLMRVFRDEQSLTEAELKKYADDMLAEIQEETDDESGSIETLYKIYGDIGVKIEIEGDVPKDAEHSAFYTIFVREGISNAVRHGFANEVLVTCRTDAEKVSMVLVNSGISLDGGIVEGGGIKELRRRLARLGGELVITTQPQFTLTAAIPNFEDKEMHEI